MLTLRAPSWPRRKTSSPSAAKENLAPLFDPVAVQAGDWDQIRANAAKVIGNAAKAGPLKR